jgi:hypothetical protein
MRSIGRVGRNVRSSAGGGEAAPSSRSDQVDARQRVVDLLHLAACCEVTQVDRREPCVLEESDHLLLRVRVVAGDEDHALTASLVWVRGEHVGAEGVAALTTGAGATRLATIRGLLMGSRSGTTP